MTEFRAFRIDRHDDAVRAVFQTMSIDDGRDNPLWVCVTTEDGFQAWSSPVFVFRS